MVNGSYGSRFGKNGPAGESLADINAWVKFLRRFISFKKYDRMIKEEDTSIAMARIGNFRKFLDFGNSSDLEIKNMTYVFSDFSQVLKSDFYLLPIEYFDL